MDDEGASKTMTTSDDSSSGVLTRSRTAKIMATTTTETLTFPLPSKKGLSSLEKEAVEAIPSSVPSILELKRKLPAHCFQPSLATSLWYVVKDASIIVGVYLALLFFESAPGIPQGLKYAILPFYWYFQGTMFWAVFVL